MPEQRNSQESRICSDLDNAAYHAHDSISKSQLDDVAVSPAYWRWRREQQRDETPAQRLGTAVHCAILEPDTFGARYVTAPKVDRRTKAGKAEWAEHLERSADFVTLDADAMQQVNDMASAVLEHPIAGVLVNAADTRVEHSLFWQDEPSGALCKARPDAINDTHGVLVDLKTTRDATYTAFARSVATYRYHVQDAWYSAGAAACGIEVPAFVFIAVDSAPPHHVACYTLSSDDRDRGALLARRNLERLVECQAAGEFPGLPMEIRELELPRWSHFEQIA